MQPERSDDRLRARQAEISQLLEKHRLLDELTHRQQTSKRDLLEVMQHRQNLAELQSRCRTLHPADLAVVLEGLPRGDRELVWRQTPPALQGEALVEMADAVRDSLIDVMDEPALVEALRHLDTDDLAFLEGKVPPGAWSTVSRERGAGEQIFLRETMAFPDDTVGHWMNRDVGTVRDSMTAEQAIADLRARDALPPLTDHLYSLDTRHVLRGAVSLAALLQAAPESPVADLVVTDVPVFAPGGLAADAVHVFERYDLIAAPVVDERGKLLGRLTIDAVMDFARMAADQAALSRAGLRHDEDLFAPILDSARNRWPWLFVNLITAFIASRVIGIFEHTIGQLVALATLMPIVASIGGNTGNQTVALVIRALALDRVSSGTFGPLLRKELTVSLLNGVLWGVVVGLFALVIYRSVPLGLVLLAAVALNLLVAALVGVAVPIGLSRAGRDPAQGSSVLLTFITDSMGFLLFLGLARLFLV